MAFDRYCIYFKKIPSYINSTVLTSNEDEGDDNVEESIRTRRNKRLGIKYKQIKF